MMSIIGFAFLLGLSGVSTLSLRNDTELGIHIAGETEQCSCNDEIKQLRADLRETQSRVMVLENSNPIGKSASDVPDVRAVYPDIIGFSVALHTTVNDVPVGSSVLYDRIHYNAGNAYDSSTGVFTCPRAGMYLFAIFVASQGPRAASVELRINGEIIIPAVSEPATNGQDSTGGNVLVHHLVAGDRVWVETYETDNQDLFHAFTTFSGALIHNTVN